MSGEILGGRRLVPALKRGKIVQGGDEKFRLTPPASERFQSGSIRMEQECSEQRESTDFKSIELHSIKYSAILNKADSQPSTRGPLGRSREKSSSRHSYRQPNVSAMAFKSGFENEGPWVLPMVRIKSNAINPPTSINMAQNVRPAICHPLNGVSEIASPEG